MSDNLNSVLFGKTEKVKLADGKEYVLREPDIETLCTLDFDISNIQDMKNVRKMTYILLCKDNPDLTEEKVGRLITLSMLNEKGQLLKALKSVLGIEEKNG